ncbi:kinesin-like protein klpA [Penicillium chermesinum]|uniref:Kinesin-like protein n=1 Tax=Penicillium chermesinum TaxID=63820 RepID=A0A9W9TIE2_9EURO|nr:kinesin-like protein klpA [Penicillium chermesinum]KAJ5223982.1 kinesin-like protein klpA [Penicillium chermesinum]
MDDENMVNKLARIPGSLAHILTCYRQNQPRVQNRSRIPQGTLREMNSATANSRSGLLPPGFIANKSLSRMAFSAIAPPRLVTSKVSANPSEATRPTTAGPYDQKKSASVTRSTTPAPKAHARNNSHAASTMSRIGSTTARPTPGSYTASVGHGARPASALAHSNSSLGLRKPLGSSVQRPATSLDTHAEDGAGSVLPQKRKGTQFSSINRSSSCPVAPEDSHRSGSICYGSTAKLLVPFEAGPKEGVNHPDQDSLKALLDPSNLPPKPPEAFQNHATPSKSYSVPMPPVRTPRSPKRPPPPLFLTKDSSTPSSNQIFQNNVDTEWNHESRERNMDEMFMTFMTRMTQQGQEASGWKDSVEIYKSRISELEKARDGLSETNLSLKVEMEHLKQQLTTAENAMKEARREQEIALDDLDRRQRAELESIKQENKKEQDATAAYHREQLRELKRKFDSEIEDEKAKRVRDLSQLTSQSAMDVQKSQIELNNKERELASLRTDFENLKSDLDRERKIVHDLRHNLDTSNSNSVTLESTIRALKARIEFLEGGREEQSQAFESCNQRMMDALAETEATKEKLRKEETLRRKLHNQVQELKGNIRVFCRVRPPLNNEPATMIAPMQYPDDAEESKEINVQGPEEKTSLGAVTRKNHTFSFDRVFGPSSQNAEVFDEISQLVQSALDGYNVCIFCYGQTGSGKTHTMSSGDGMIPRAVHQIYDTARGLEEKGWRYTMEGNFVEVYNENLNDLLGNPDELDKKKHEIRHDMQRGKTIITDINTVELESPEMVESILERAAANRSVAATKANERSSRSHSVFILKLKGENHITGERSEGTLNLVDLAGSERLSHSGATGERLKETQNINRSLSSLGDVIAALGQGKDGGHIPYRNSKLTYLLQFSLGGNSKTLMFVMVSPLQAHLSETLTSLKFATKVHNTHIGTAKRQARVRDC